METDVICAEHYCLPLKITSHDKLEIKISFTQTEVNDIIINFAVNIVGFCDLGVNTDEKRKFIKLI